MSRISKRARRSRSKSDSGIELTRIHQPFTDDVRIWREPENGEDQIGTVHTNVPHSCILHSPAGFECGYAGSGPADLALNILSAFVPPRAGKAVQSHLCDLDDADPCVTLKGVASYFAFKWHQAFKFEFIAPMDRSGGSLSAQSIQAWIAAHRSSVNT